LPISFRLDFLSHRFPFRFFHLLASFRVCKPCFEFHSGFNDRLSSPRSFCRGACQRFHVLSFNRDAATANLSVLLLMITVKILPLFLLSDARLTTSTSSPSAAQPPPAVAPPIPAVPPPPALLAANYIYLCALMRWCATCIGLRGRIRRLPTRVSVV